MARAATPGPWWHNPSKLWMDPNAFEAYDRTKGTEFVGYGSPHPFTGCIASTGPADHPQSMADAAHIARHEPTRVLAGIAAKRQVLAVCDRTESQDSRGMSWVVREVLAGLALPYADHDDYRPEWKPRP